MIGLFGNIRILTLDIDGTLTDGTTTWLGDDIGWTQTYSVRDGEAILTLLEAGLSVVPLSRNRTLCARKRIEHLGLPTKWIGLTDKLGGLHELARELGVGHEFICHVGDGRDDVPVFAAVGVPCAVGSAHPDARAAAKYVTERGGGEHAIEEIAQLILRARTGQP